MDPDADLKDKYNLELAAAFVLGHAPSLTHEKLVRMGQAAGLKMHRFKRSQTLPRVAKVIGMLKSLAPVNLLDIGSGRGTGLTQVLLEFPELDIAAVECDEKLLPNLRALSRGLEVVRSTGSLNVYNVDATTPLPFQEGEFDVGTALEVLEHIQDTQKAVNEIVRVCRKVVFSVPSEPDDNPEHVHLHTQADIRRMFFAAGAKRVTFDPVPGHTVGIAHVWE